VETRSRFLEQEGIHVVASLVETHELMSVEMGTRMGMEWERNGSGREGEEYYFILQITIEESTTLCFGHPWVEARRVLWYRRVYVCMRVAISG
jgi:hypothetical protein